MEQQIRDKIKDKLKDLPERSGVYIMRDIYGNIIYIGKAVVLKSRVRSYFQNSAKPPKVAAMVERVADFEYIITISELDALILEANLIKKHRPQYNILLKDDKAAPYIRIDFKEDFPRLEVVRRIKADGARYFGPFIMGVSVREVVDIIRAAYKLRSCTSFRVGQRACLDYHIELCHAPCTGCVSKQEYRASLDKACAFLGGKVEEARQLIEQRMEFAAQNEEFERAINYRDKLAVLKRLKEKAVTSLTRDIDVDFFAYAAHEGQAAVCVLNVRGGKTMGLKSFAINDIGEQAGEALHSFVAQYYSAKPLFPHEIALSHEGAGADALEGFIRASAGRAVQVYVPQKGSKAHLMRTASENALDFLIKAHQRLQRSEQMTVGAVDELQRLLDLRARPRRIECYDISNISGTDNVASMSVCLEGEAHKKSYRRFKIRTVEGANDFLCMREAILRRLDKLGNATFGEKPDLIVIDGGKGQLSMVADEITSHGIEVVSLAKRCEEVFLPHLSQSKILPRDSSALKLLIRVRDEAHRFGVSYHRTLRSKRYRSELKGIRGVGDGTVRALFEHFKDINLIKAASIEELAAVKGVNKTSALNIFNYFREN